MATNAIRLPLTNARPAESTLDQSDDNTLSAIQAINTKDGHGIVLDDSTYNKLESIISANNPKNGLYIFNGSQMKRDEWRLS